MWKMCLRLFLIGGLILLAVLIGPGGWMTVVVGEQSAPRISQRLRDAGIVMDSPDMLEGQNFFEIIDSPDFKISPERRELKLVVVRTAALGLPTDVKEDVEMELTESRVKAAGYELCPMEAVPLIALRINNELHQTYVGIKPIMGKQGKLAYPVVRRFNGKTQLVFRQLTQSKDAPRSIILVARSLKK